MKKIPDVRIKLVIKKSIVTILREFNETEISKHYTTY